MKEFKTIVFATDFSENSDYAFEYAFSIAQKYQARLVLIHVVSEP